MGGRGLGLWVAVPEGVAKDKPETCRWLVIPPELWPRCDRGSGIISRELTEGNSEIGDEAPAEHLRPTNLSAFILTTFPSGKRGSGD